METEPERLFNRIRVLNAILAQVRVDGDRREVEQAIEGVRAHDISRLRQLGHHYDDGDGDPFS
jgi:hypothetical protein